MSETEVGEHGKSTGTVLKPHTRADMWRVGWVILLVSLPVAGIGYRFLRQQEDVATASQNLAAAIMFWFIALMLLSVGAGILVKARRMPRD